CRSARVEALARSGTRELLRSDHSLFWVIALPRCARVVTVGSVSASAPSSCVLETCQSHGRFGNTTPAHVRLAARDEGRGSELNRPGFAGDSVTCSSPHDWGRLAAYYSTNFLPPPPTS